MEKVQPILNETFQALNGFYEFTVIAYPPSLSLWDNDTNTYTWQHLVIIKAINLYNHKHTTFPVLYKQGGYKSIEDAINHPIEYGDKSLYAKDIVLAVASDVKVVEDYNIIQFLDEFFSDSGGSKVVKYVNTYLECLKYHKEFEKIGLIGRKIDKLFEELDSL